MSIIEEATLRAELERILSEHLGSPQRVQAIDRKPCLYRTSFPLEELDVELAGGARLQIMLKDLSHDSLTPDAARAKQRFMHDPTREIQVYRLVLAPAALGTPLFYGEGTEPRTGRHWLFIEKVAGDVLWQVGELETWAAAARWLAELHERFRGQAADWDFLVRYDRAFWALWIERAAGIARDAGAGAWDKAQRDRVLGLAAGYGAVVDRLVTLPQTFVHGEFYPSNVLVGIGPDPARRRIAPIDWEVAATGPGLVDLAALTTGWGRDQSAGIVAAYRERHDPPTAGLPFDEALAACRLHLAVQWLGAEPSWSPPAQHRRDWLAEAELHARRLGL